MRVEVSTERAAGEGFLRHLDRYRDTVMVQMEETISRRRFHRCAGFAELAGAGAMRALPSVGVGV